MGKENNLIGGGWWCSKCNVTHKSFEKCPEHRVKHPVCTTEVCVMDKLSGIPVIPDIRVKRGTYKLRKLICVHPDSIEDFKEMIKKNEIP